MVNAELDALLALQASDGVIREIEGRRAALSPRLALLDVTQKRTVEEVGRIESSLERELTRQRLLDARIADLRSTHDRAAGALAAAERISDAAAAASQVEVARRALAETESEAHGVSRRVADLRTALAAHREVLAQVSQDQGDARSELERQRALLDAELATARMHRQLSASTVSADLLGKYERIALRRRSDAVIELRDFSCGACDTAIPLQRRPFMMAGGRIELCEACGVLLYRKARE
ncbi:zinc ribbon domain-containing protein [Gemmatimonas sp.]